MQCDAHHRRVAAYVESDTLLSIQMLNGSVFSLGGLSDRQTQQLTHLSSGLINARVRFQYSHTNAFGEVVNAVFQTLLIDGDSRHKTSSAVLEGSINNMQGVQHG